MKSPPRPSTWIAAQTTGSGRLSRTIPSAVAALVGQAIVVCGLSATTAADENGSLYHRLKPVLWDGLQAVQGSQGRPAGCAGGQPEGILRDRDRLKSVVRLAALKPPKDSDILQCRKGIAKSAAAIRQSDKLTT